LIRALTTFLFRRGLLSHFVSFLTLSLRTLGLADSSEDGIENEKEHVDVNVHCFIVNYTDRIGRNARLRKKNMR